jgi:poly-gamma-glutamate synthesis protein (capsule biosynthesis protein)
VAFVLLFVVGALGFIAQVLMAVERGGASPRPSAATGSAAAVVSVAAERTVAQAQAVDPSSPFASVLPSTEPRPSQPAVPPCGDPSEAIGPSGSPGFTSPSPAAGVLSPDIDPTAMPASPGPSSSALPGCVEPSPAISSTPPLGERRDMPFVPVVRFWQTRESISSDALVRALRGRGSDWDRVLIPTGDRRALEEALDVTIPDAIREADASAIVKAVKKGNTLGILRAPDVRPSIRALAIDGRALFGNDRVAGIGRWPLVARVDVSDRETWRQADTWTLVAGGDSFTDRGIYERVVNRKKGLDYPFNGGTARVTGHHICPSCPRAEGNSVPVYKLSGPRGIVRDLVRDADLAIANHEQPTPTNWSFHLFGTRFSGRPSLTEIFTRAGIDFMSLANNHIKDYGAPGVLNTIKTLDRYGIKHAGAGKDLKAAARPAYLTAKGVRVGIVSCDMIALGHVSATKRSPGAAPCKSREVVAAIKEARRKADVLIVFPHWGIEFSRGRAAYQEKLAKRWARMGVDLVVGAHAHVPGGIGEVDGMPVFYSIGNFIFDQSWSTATMEGILAEMTFQGDELVQIRVHPFLTHDQAQPNLLDPARDDGAALMGEIRKASKKVSDW